VCYFLEIQIHRKNQRIFRTDVEPPLTRSKPSTTMNTPPTQNFNSNNQNTPHTISAQQTSTLNPPQTSGTTSTPTVPSVVRNKILRPDDVRSLLRLVGQIKKAEEVKLNREESYTANMWVAKVANNYDLGKEVKDAISYLANIGVKDINSALSQKTGTEERPIFWITANSANSFKTVTNLEGASKKRWSINDIGTSYRLVYHTYSLKSKAEIESSIKDIDSNIEGISFSNGYVTMYFENMEQLLRFRAENKLIKLPSNDTLILESFADITNNKKIIKTLLITQNIAIEEEIKDILEEFQIKLYIIVPNTKCSVYIYTTPTDYVIFKEVVIKFSKKFPLRLNWKEGIKKEQERYDINSLSKLTK
jgi:hypothetical protein